jgi:hypothetical protein
LNLLSSPVARARGSVNEYNQSLWQSIQNQMATQTLLTQGKSAMEASAAITKDQADAWNANAEAIKRATAALANSPAQQKPNYDQTSVLDRMREKIAQLAATWDGTQSGLLTKQRTIAAQMLGEAQKNSKDYLAIQLEIARLDVQYRQAAGNEIIAQARTQVAEITGDTSHGALERLERERDTWQQVLAGEKLTAAQRVEVQRSLNQSIATLNKERQAQAIAITRSDTDTEIAISRLKIEAQKNALTQVTAATQEQAAQRLAILKELTNAEYALNVAQLQTELGGLKQGTAEYERVYNQIKLLKAKLNVDLTALDKEYASESARAAREQVNAWHAVVEGIQNAESRMAADLIGGRTTLNQSLLRLGQDLITREIQNDLKAMTTRILLNRQEGAAKKAVSEGGFIYHLMTKQRETAAEVTSQAARTSAVVAGETTRLATQQAAAATSAATSKSLGSKTVMQDAAKAFSGTYAAVAQIPYVGWILAPIAAGAAFAAVAAYEGLASLDVGAWNVPHDMVAQIHKGESVVPTTFAEGMRQNGGFTGAARDDGGGGNRRPETLRVQRAGRNHVVVTNRDLAKALKNLNSRFAL